MSKYIDADVLIKDTIQEFINPKPFRDTIMRMINKAPSIDIVRCKECRWYRAYADQYGCWERCDRTMMEANTDGFCSYGKRREDGDNNTMLR